MYTPTNQKKIEQYLPEQLLKCSHVWLRVDRIKRPLEAPYQGPFKVLKREDDTFTISIRDKPTVVSIDRIKPATLPSSFAENVVPEVKAAEESVAGEQPHLVTSEKKTKSGRTVRFKEDPQYCYD